MHTNLLSIIFLFQDWLTGSVSCASINTAVDESLLKRNEALLRRAVKEQLKPLLQHLEGYSKCGGPSTYMLNLGTYIGTYVCKYICTYTMRCPNMTGVCAICIECFLFLLYTYVRMYVIIN